VLETEVSKMAVFNEPTCDNNIKMFEFFDDMKANDVFLLMTTSCGKSFERK